MSKLIFLDMLIWILTQFSFTTVELGSMSVELVKMLYFVGFSGEKYTFYSEV